MFFITRFKWRLSHVTQEPEGLDIILELSTAFGEAIYKLLNNKYKDGLIFDIG